MQTDGSELAKFPRSSRLVLAPNPNPPITGREVISASVFTVESLKIRMSVSVVGGVCANSVLFAFFQTRSR